MAVGRGGRTLGQKRTDVKQYLTFSLLVASHLAKENTGTAHYPAIKKLVLDLEFIYNAY